MDEAPIEVKPEDAASNSPCSAGTREKKQTKRLLPFLEWKKSKGSVGLTREELLEDLFDDFVIQNYSNHPGFPRSDAALDRYRKYVYYDNSRYFKVPLTREEMRKVEKSRYRQQVSLWFDEGDWLRFPNILSKEEVDALSDDLRQEYNNFCYSSRGVDKYDAINFRGRRNAWEEIAICPVFPRTLKSFNEFREMAEKAANTSKFARVKGKKPTKPLGPYFEDRFSELGYGLTREEILEDLFDDFVIQTYSNHPGFPRTDAALDRYRKYVYFDNSGHLGVSITREEFRTCYKEEYWDQLHCWFNKGDWCRFPNVLSEDEVDALSHDLKQKYDTLCKVAPRLTYMPDECDYDFFLSRVLMWTTIATGRRYCYEGGSAHLSSEIEEAAQQLIREESRV